MKRKAMHELLRRHTFVQANKVHDRLFKRPEGQKIQQREDDLLKEMEVPDIGEFVQHVNGGPRMVVDGFDFYPDDDGSFEVVCSWWDKLEGGWKLNRKGFGHKLLINEEANDNG